MNFFRIPLKILLAVVAALQLSACSKTVQWEEEVPLNTGETIWVKREVVYKLKGGGDNPLDMAYRPDWTEEISFEWKGKKYRYVGDAFVILLAISPQTHQPVLVAKASYKDWNRRHNYRCTTPFYVQFMPPADGEAWAWPPAIEPWLFNMSYNLMIHRDEMTRMKARYTSHDRVALDRTVATQDQSNVRIDPTYKSNHCSKQEK